MKFAHMGDCHLGGWRFPELQELNMQSFSRAIEICIKEEVEMVLVAGDLFDSAYPGIDTLKQAFAEFKKLHDAEIPCFIIAGSHDYSVSGKTFLDVLEHAGFCKNVAIFDEKDGRIFVSPTIFKNYAIYGYPGKKSGLEIEELKKINLQDSPGFFKILMLHTTIKEASANLPIPSIKISELPQANYYALAHLHVDFTKQNLIYSGPIFPNNFEELEEINHGQFYIIECTDTIKTKKILLNLKEIVKIEMEIDNTLTATEKIMSELNKLFFEDKIVLLKLKGVLEQGKISDIQFDRIEKFVKGRKAYAFLKNISRLSVEMLKPYIEVNDVHEVEEAMIKKYLEGSTEKFADKIPVIINALNIEKNEGESSSDFQDRFVSEIKKILNF